MNSLNPTFQQNLNLDSVLTSSLPSIVDQSKDRLTGQLLDYSIKDIAIETAKVAPKPLQKVTDITKTIIFTFIPETDEDVTVGSPKEYPVKVTAEYSTRVLNYWIGEVVDITTDGFVAILRDLTLDNRPEEKAEFSLMEVFQDDHPLVEVGATFYWSISFKTDLKIGRPTIEDRIDFRRLPVYTEKQIADIEDLAEEIYVRLAKRERPSEKT